MEEFVGYVNKTALGLLPVEHNRIFNNYYLEFRVNCSADLHIDGEYVSTRHLLYLYAHISDSGVFMASCDFLHDEMKRWTQTNLLRDSDEERVGVLQLVVKGFPVITLENWVARQNHWCPYARGNWLELADPKARNLFDAVVARRRAK